MSRNSFIVWFSKKSLILIFLFGKMIRMVFYFTFLYFLVSKTEGILGFSKNETLFFTATYVLVDSFCQFLFRNVYSFRRMIVSGDFDLVLIKPINPLFRSLLGGADVVDLITLPAVLFIVIYFGFLLNPSAINIFYYILLIINGIIISGAFHIAILALAIISFEIDHTVMIYRDISSMGRFPVDIYKEPLKSFITYIIPVGVMFTIPAKSFMGIISPIGVISSIFFGMGVFAISLKFWKYSLKKYSSASS